MNKTLYVTRLKDDGEQTISRCSLHYDLGTLFTFASLELPYKNNERMISCIPEGKYKGRVRTSQKYGRHLIVLNVPNRSFILFHAGNYNTQTKGCLLIGDGFKDINKDGLVDVVNSRNTMNELMSLIDDGEEVDIIITKAIMDGSKNNRVHSS